MAKVNLAIGMKGGIGKSLIASTMAQYVSEKRRDADKAPPLWEQLLTFRVP
jgi:CO dehydrogenase nickel-insertion accessory protein CooC1